MSDCTDKSIFDLLGRAPIEVSSLAPLTFRTRLLGPQGFDSARGPASRIGAVASFVRTGLPWKTVSINLPWDAADAAEAARLPEILAKENVNPGCVVLDLSRDFTVPGKEDILNYGTLTSPDGTVRAAAFARLEATLGIMRAVGSDALVLCLPDGWDSPAQASFFETALRLEESLMRFYAKMHHDEYLLITCSSPGPGSYSSAIFNSGRAREICSKLGLNARVLLSAPTSFTDCSIEQTMAFLLRSDSFGGVKFSGQSCYGGPHAAGRYDYHGTFRMALVLLEGEHLNYAPISGLSFILDRFTNAPDPYPEIESTASMLAESFIKAAKVDFFALADARNRPWTGDAEKMIRNAFQRDAAGEYGRFRDMSVKAGPE